MIQEMKEREAGAGKQPLQRCDVWFRAANTADRHSRRCDANMRVCPIRRRGSYGCPALARYSESIGLIASAARWSLVCSPPSISSIFCQRSLICWGDVASQTVSSRFSFS